MAKLLNKRLQFFQVHVDGKLVHSRKSGDGFVDNQAKLARIVEAVEKSIA